MHTYILNEKRGSDVQRVNHINECMYLQPRVQVDQGHYNANVHDVEKEKQNGFVYVHLQRCGVCMWGRRGQFIHLNAGSAKIRGFVW